MLTRKSVQALALWDVSCGLRSACVQLRDDDCKTCNVRHKDDAQQQQCALLPLVGSCLSHAADHQMGQFLESLGSPAAQQENDEE